MSDEPPSNIIKLHGDLPDLPAAGIFPGRVASARKELRNAIASLCSAPLDALAARRRAVELRADQPPDADPEPTARSLLSWEKTFRDAAMQIGTDRAREILGDIQRIVDVATPPKRKRRKRHRSRPPLSDRLLPLLFRPLMKLPRLHLPPPSRRE